MPDEKRSTVDDEVIGERRHLVSLAYRMLGTIAEAEDAVQETYTRWYRMSQTERDAINVPRGWLTRVASRVCLDVLSSARVRREQYVGPWLPEPVPSTAFGTTEGDPLEHVTLDESISTALLVVLESMTPAERVVFVLHDVFALPFSDIGGIVGRTPAACRQLATAARRRVDQSRARQVPRTEHDAVVRAFAAASRGGDLNALVKILDPDVVLRSDGGGIVTAARNPIFGADRVARFLLGVQQKNDRTEVLEQETPDGLGFAIWEEGHIAGVVTLEVIGGLIANVRMVLNPQKLSLWADPV
ncbi:RNA polymerase sigma factor SigJ [Herbiconiux sp. CPCC 205716]|uniref:RNA polymerase sigma factor SigJ n=1 Tax=Herbiconiux gentiana TaxID=2970912 RepID=A0ABT2GAK9_9MICO|nr:RNA polymerase sigma factor SigJ [Herbiconiux gentiana]MCS5713210.1 RNA polymerase sigma factor SigJ [Herbiconiux gentiana]